MTDDRFVKDTARDPEREALGSMRAGLRAAAKKAVRKVAKKAGRKKVAKKATTAAGKAAARGAAPAKKADRAARTTADAPASGSTGTRASGGAAQSRAPRAAAASESVAAASAAPSRESGPSIDTPRPPGPMHPGAVMDSMQEQSGGLGGLLALWGPLIIVGFLVLVFRGGDEPETAVAADTDPPDPAPIDATAGIARAAAPSGAAPGPAETFDGGFAMRTSMAGPPVLAGRGAGAPGALYPSPPGPYRDPRYRSLPTGESWSADATGEWMWSAEARVGTQPADGGAAPVRWVRCEAPYYWCPAPTSPAW